MTVGFYLESNIYKTTEKDDKEEEPAWGRACTLYPRTLEMMEHLELLDTMNQTGLHRTQQRHFQGRKASDFARISQTL